MSKSIFGGKKKPKAASAPEQQKTATWTPIITQLSGTQAQQLPGAADRLRRRNLVTERTQTILSDKLGA